MPYTVRDLLTETFVDLTVLAVGETMDPTMSNNGLSKLVRLFDNWNAERAGVYANNPLTSYTLIASQNPHTIGPDSADFTVTQRPVSIDYANLVIETIRYGLTITNAQQWASLPDPELETTMPGYLHYEATWPNGNIYLYPVPSAAYEIELLTRIVLADVGLDDTVSMPPGYRDAVILTAGEMLAQGYPTAIPNPAAAAAARARIFANNDDLPALITRDSGVPYSGSGRGRWFDYRSGMLWP